MRSRRSSCYTADRQSWDTVTGTAEPGCRYDLLQAAMQSSGLRWQVLSRTDRSAKRTLLEEGLAVNFLYDMGAELSQVCLFRSYRPIHLSCALAGSRGDSEV